MDLRSLRTSVAFRVVGLFILSALVPVVVLALVSFSAINGQLEEHSRERLEQLSRNGGQSILQKIRESEAALRRARERLDASEDPTAVAAVLPPALHSLGVTLGNQSTTALAGRQWSPSRLTVEELTILSQDGTVVGLDPGSPPSVSIATPRREGAPEGDLIWALAHPDSLWSAAETFATLPSVADFCVLASPDVPIHCSSGRMDFPAAFAAEGESRTLGTFRHDVDGAAYIVGFWSFYPQVAFDRSPWTVLVVESRESVYAPGGIFAVVFGSSLVLALLLVALLSKVQIRRTLEPLAALTEGTRRFAEGDRTTRVDVHTEDEFGLLAGSFNDMASEIGAQIRQFEAVQAVGQAALGAAEQDAVLRSALRQLPGVSGCKAAAILQCGSGAGAPARLAWQLDDETVTGIDLQLTDDDLAWLRQNRPHGEDREGTTSFFESARRGLGGGVLVALPHVIKGHPRGATILELPRGQTTLPKEVRRRSRQIADQVAVALDEVRLVKELDELSWGAIVALARAIDAKSQWTSGHSERVTEMALALGRELRLTEEQIDLLHKGGLLHDVGKIGVPNAILDKPSKPTEEEFAQIRQHPAIGVRILSPIPAFADALPIVRHHHERLDGNGYPDGLAGEEIPYLARVMCVADAYDAIASARPYRPGRPPHEVLEAILRDSGTQFDPEVVQALERVLAARGVLPETAAAH